MAAEVDDKLAEYRRKRDFQKTPEPDGGAPTARGDFFCVQQHAARQLHYDFRLELDGVLLSWAVPKGLSMKALEKRLAMRTEDHPLDYGEFEGVIPKNEYGGGTVQLWDKGTWVPLKDPREGLKNGKLEFRLLGQKLSGEFHMFRTKGYGKGDSWMIFKGRDAFARDAPDVLDLRQSVASGRTLQEIAAAPSAVWHSNRGAAAAPEPPGLIELLEQLPTKVKLTNLGKLLYAESGVSKAELVAYYASMADKLLPAIAQRPLTLLRGPDGWHDAFVQKHGSQGVPHALYRVGEYLEVRDLEGLIALGQLAVLEVHPWGCHSSDFEKPDLLVMDLDPDPALPWAAVATGALALRELLKADGLQSFVKTTGGKGAHVVAPLTGLDWEAFKAYAKSLAERLAKVAPRHFTVNPKKSARAGKTYVDYLRNARGATAVAAYSPRAREGATVSCPISWDELPQVEPKSLTVRTVPSRKGDPWAGLAAVRSQRLGES